MSGRPRGHHSGPWYEKLVTWLVAAGFWLVVGITMATMTYIAARSLGGISLEFILAMPQDRGLSGGIFPAIVGTIWLTVGTALVAVPVGILSAIYLTEYARPGLILRLINLAVVNLAGVPSVVYGLFGLTLFVLFLGMGSSVGAASLTLGFLTLPVVVTATREALVAVPVSYREAAYALGATRRQVILTHVLPYARTGIAAGSLLGLSRAMGETAPILATGVAFVLPRLPSGFGSRFMALPYHLYISATQVPGMPVQRIWASALTLLFMVLCLNVLAGFVRPGRSGKEIS